MVRTVLTNGIQGVPQTGLDLVFEAITVDGKKIPNNGKVIIVIRNGSGGTRTVTIQTPAVVEGDLAIGERIIGSILTTEDRYIANLTPGTYNQQSGADAGSLFIDVDTDTSVTIAAMQV